MKKTRTGKKRHYKKKRLNKSLPVVMNYADRPENRSLTKFYKPLPFPTVKRVKLSYSNTVNLNSYAGSTYFGSSKGIYLNSLNSPEISGGHQPYGYDTLCGATGGTPIYQRYKVLGAKVRLKFLAPGGGDNEAALNSIVAGVMVNNITQSQDIAGLSIGYVSETNMSQVVHVPATGSQHGMISFYLPMYKAFNWDKKSYSRDMNNSTAPYNSNPGSLVKMYIASANFRASATVTTVYCHYEITYYCELYARNILAQS